MKATDLEKARLIAGARAQNITMRSRLAAGETLTLCIGDGSDAANIVLMPRYLAEIRSDLIAAFDLRICENDAALGSLGVDVDG
ncbi:hypothetical protein [Mesorhizobium sp. M7A.F.Ca.ET.027.03.2.1]|uniref:hypothetical protein n=1 Tax=Mesorhizobium sp. M7A.F.Ca.ET.027.03.2.1 TaxID=2496656 RepID=UPI000FCB17F3|nr:hypothetical protein [Mesorhizobium sp. M7A.F.Ca.ET.027.03.2.1]RVD65254.1 hypothetical protein EN750_08935 [Mesorhizobium sp. M7A.F.Ca.ET.027.03.2.1]